VKILISAYSCGPTATSEPGNAWRAVNHALAEGHEVWTIADENHYKADTLAYLAEHPMPGYHPQFFSLARPVAKALQRSGMIGAIYYHWWQHRLLTVAKELHRQVGFDVAHHVTFGRYWTPSGVRNLGISFIWGPVGAAEHAPRPFVTELPLRDRFFEFVRDSVRAVSQLDPALRETARRATIAIGISRESCDELRKLGAPRVEQLPQAALADTELDFFSQFPPPPPGPFRAMCMGRHLHWKGFHLAIRAFALFHRTSPGSELWIANNGPFRGELEKTVQREGVADCVKFLGRVPTYEALMEKLAETHVLMHPALHEAFGNVCMEALATGRPVVCLDIGGPASQVTPECGFIAPANNPAESIAAMASFLTRIDNDRALLARMSVKARERVREKFTMRKMGDTISSYYREVTSLPRV
jgi:glycosyltransferase involved in cell wall biosynthesis